MYTPNKHAKPGCGTTHSIPEKTTPILADKKVKPTNEPFATHPHISTEAAATTMKTRK